ALEALNQVRRFHGGVALALDPDLLDQLEFGAQAQVAVVAKRTIGQAAAQLITSGQLVALAAGTTTTQVALALRGRENLAIMTNALNIAQDLSREPGIRLTCAGGEVHGDYYTLTGPVTERALSAQTYDLAVVGVSGISLERGFTVNSLSNAASIGIMLRNARRRMIVADHSKFGQVSYAFLVELNQVDSLVTDIAPPLPYRQRFRRWGGVDRGGAGTRLARATLRGWDGSNGQPHLAGRGCWALRRCASIGPLAWRFAHAGHNV
ncbi:MAG: DeoR/GlpR transcriptional regulator, partial [Anaerolineae bacterium]|nr:DeoR/GlpR transcriptional regulator [Anaerolineae bacterium]